MRAKLLLAGAAALVLAGCGGEKQGAAAPESGGRVVVAEAAEREVPEYVEAVGTVRATQLAQMAAQVMANITRVHVKEGDRVRRGQVLVSLDAAAAAAGYQRASSGASGAEQERLAAEADYALAQSTYERYRGLQAKNSVSPQEMDEVEARYRAAAARRERAQAGVAEARAAASQARTMLGYSQLRAPFDGVVTARFADEGTLAAPGAPLVVVEDLSAFRLEISVDEADVAALGAGASVPVVIEALGNDTITAKVARIVPAADPGSRTFLVKLDLPRDARLRSGLYGRARLARGTRKAVLVPADALLARGQVQAVYVVGTDEVATLRYVTAGGRFDDDVEVLSGVSAGERVVRDPQQRELAGRRVEVAR